ncbi:MAG: hypothetical protein KAT34_22855 [Candidatus Aminicenantes bacterium]|nr:hypothetical protein [Candidatus Aminicenantes bacterium]
MKEGPNIHIGPPVWGCDFFDRKKTIDVCWEKLRNNSIILSAPRRYGKSSVMLHLRDKPSMEFFPIYFELEDHFSLAGFVYEFVSKILEHDKSIMKKFKKGFSKIFKGIGEMSFWKFKIKLKKTIEDEGDWEEWKERIQQMIIDLVKTKESKKLLFILDEFPLMLSNFIKQGEKGETEAVKLLQWLRKIRHESPFLENVRFVLGGSIGIEKVISYLKATRTINDIETVQIGAFEPHVAVDFIKKIFETKELEVDKNVIKAIIEAVGTLIPIYLHIMIDSIIKESMNTGRKIEPALVKECYEKRVHGPEYKCYFEDYYERLWRYYLNEEAKSAKRMLRELATADDGIPIDRLFLIYQEEMRNRGDKEKFDLLLSALESDFYIERDRGEKKVYFHNKWLKDWWRIYHGA